MNQILLERLCGVVGADHVLTDMDLGAYEEDWNRRARGKALAVVRPADTVQTAQVIRICADAGVGLVPQGGNTGLNLGAIPDGSGTQVVLSTKRMNAIRAIDVANLTATVEAGCVLQTLQEAARAHNLLFPLSLAAEGSCTIGGNLATNAGGTQVLRYGNARELCLGIECVTAAGEVWNGLTALRKDNTGYDLRNLMVGSEGTLAIITAATLRLYPLPRTQTTAWVALPGIHEALRLLQRAQSILGPSLSGFEIIGREPVEQVGRHFAELARPCGDSSTPWFVLMDVWNNLDDGRAREEVESLLAGALESGEAHDAVIATSQAQSAKLWRIRESIPEAQARDGLNIKHDISVPVSALPDFVMELQSVLAAAVPGARFMTFGHMGDGNLHYNLQAPFGADADAFRARYERQVNGLVYEHVARFGGSFSAEHGIGSHKVEQLASSKSPTALWMMRGVKQALDPRGILNPGKVLG
ncbi:MAG: FAD-binding oxidoreductase [Comamonadaceae bacterium]|nr:FAD-binding oxidoreductase [Comamonadaceae bacterium]